MLVSGCEGLWVNHDSASLMMSIAQVNAVFAQGLINKFGAEAFQGSTAWAATIDVPGGCTSSSEDGGPTSTPVCDAPTKITFQQLKDLIVANNQNSNPLINGIAFWKWKNKPINTGSFNKNFL